MVALVWGIVGVVFAIVGAWPIMPFLGLEVLLLIAAFKLSNHTSQAQETVNLTPTTLTVRRVDHWGKHSDFTFPAAWLQVNMDDPPTTKSRIELRSRGRSVHIGGFLAPAERLDLARTLRRHLSRLSGTSAGNVFLT